MQGRVCRLLAGLAGRKEEVEHRCRSVPQSRAEGLLHNPHPGPHDQPMHIPSWLWFRMGTSCPRRVESPRGCSLDCPNLYPVKGKIDRAHCPPWESEGRPLGPYRTEALRWRAGSLPEWRYRKLSRTGWEVISISKSHKHRLVPEHGFPAPAAIGTIGLVGSLSKPMAKRGLPAVWIAYL